MSWWFQSNEGEKQELLLLVDAGYREGFEAEVVRITKPLNLDSKKLAQLLASMVKVDNISRARKLVDVSIPRERLAKGPRTVAFVMCLPLEVAFWVLQGLWRWWLRFARAVFPS